MAGACGNQSWRTTLQPEHMTPETRGASPLSVMSMSVVAGTSGFQIGGVWVESGLHLARPS